MESRQIRGYSILAQGVEPEEMGNYTYKIPSQNGNGTYIVQRPNKAGYQRWTCTCPDFQFRGLKCKHIYSVDFWLQLKGQVDCEIVKTVIPDPESKLCCPYCKSEKVVKNGSRKCKTMTKIRYLCKDCKKTFIEDKDFEKIKVTPEMLTVTLDLYFKGVSLRKISDHIGQIYKTKICKSSVHNWIMQYMGTISKYTDGLTPKVGGMWHTDEMMVKVKGEWQYLWNTIDNQTKFMLANNMTTDRFSEDARQVFSKAKEIAKKNPHIMVTDGLGAYRQAFKDEFYSKDEGLCRHIAGVGLRGDRNNNVVERYHNTVRERDKVMRGLKADKSARIIHNGIKDYYNFIRPHQGLDGKTPAEMAGIELESDGNRWLGLLRRSVKK